jgi:hypothetical protein
MLAVGALTLLSQCAPTCGAGAGQISWEGRPAVAVVAMNGAPLSDVQAALDRGQVVDIGYEGHHHVAGHYSSHGSVFAAGPNLDPGEEIRFDGDVYVVTGRDSAPAGAVWTFQDGLTVQYSGCGGACLVRAREG